MPNVLECLEQAKYLVEKGLGQEAAKLVLPKREAAKRKANKEKRTRVIYVTTPENFAAFHGARAHVIEVVGNPTLADQLIAEVISRVPDETWRTFVEAGDDARIQT
jgi:hypothetical protein